MVPSFWAPFILGSPAHANTSARAPWASWVRSVGKPAKLKVTLVPGLACSMVSPISLNASVKEAAVKIVMAPGGGGPQRTPGRYASLHGDRQETARAAAP